MPRRNQIPASQILSCRLLIPSLFLLLYLTWAPPASAGSLPRSSDVLDQISGGGVARGDFRHASVNSSRTSGKTDPGKFDPRGHLERMHPEFRSRFITMVKSLAARGIRLRITDGMRTFEEQDALYQKGRRFVDGKWICPTPKCPDKVTDAKGGYSNHNYGMAVDSYPFVDGVFHNPGAIPKAVRARYTALQTEIGLEAERAGLTWGGRWKKMTDRPHVQLLGVEELPTKKCLEIFLRKRSLQDVWDYASSHLSRRP